MTTWLHPTKQRRAELLQCGFGIKAGRDRTNIAGGDVPDRTSSLTMRGGVGRKLRAGRADRLLERRCSAQTSATPNVIPRKRTMRRIPRHRVYRGFEHGEKEDAQPYS